MRIVTCPKKPFTAKPDENMKPFLVLSPIKQEDQNHGETKERTIQC